MGLGFPSGEESPLGADEPRQTHLGDTQHRLKKPYFLSSRFQPARFLCRFLFHLAGFRSAELVSGVFIMGVIDRGAEIRGRVAGRGVLQSFRRTIAITSGFVVEFGHGGMAPHITVLEDQEQGKQRGTHGVAFRSAPLDVDFMTLRLLIYPVAACIHVDFSGGLHAVAASLAI